MNPDQTAAIRRNVRMLSTLFSNGPKSSWRGPRLRLRWATGHERPAASPCKRTGLYTTLAIRKSRSISPPAALPVSTSDRPRGGRRSLRPRSEPVVDLGGELLEVLGRPGQTFADPCWVDPEVVVYEDVSEAAESLHLGSERRGDHALRRQPFEDLFVALGS